MKYSLLGESFGMLHFSNVEGHVHIFGQGLHGLHSRCMLRTQGKRSMQAYAQIFPNFMTEH